MPEATPAQRAKMARISALLHALQTGVGASIEVAGDTAQIEGKHLRVGVNHALCDLGAMQELLVDKGLITWDELFDRQIAYLEREVDSYRDRVSRRLGAPVDLA